jgi:hypothetical protein
MPRSKRPLSVSAATLSKSIEQAVTRAAKQFGVTPSEPNFFPNWKIIGRLIRDLDAGQAFELATAISTAVKVKGIDPAPAIARVGKDILVGFIERSQLPLSFG